jgi:hypothetical protein
LETSETVGGPSKLAIHIAESVFPTDDIGQQTIIADFVVPIGFRANAY